MKCQLIFKIILKIIFNKRTLIGVCVCLLLLGIYGFFYAKYCFNYEGNSTAMSSLLADLRHDFFNFKYKENRWPSCMDEVLLFPEKKDRWQLENMDFFNDLPLRCVTLRNMYYYVGDDKRKVLVTLYKPYRTRLWPFGEMQTIVLLDNGSTCIVSPDEIIIEK